MRFRTALPLLLLLGCLPVHAECEQEGLAQALARQLQPARNLKDEFSACKAWPADPSLTLVAFALVDDDEVDEHDFDADMEVVLVKTDSHEVMASYYRRNAWSSDALELADVTLDTARYQLSRETRAFGVRVHYATTTTRANASAREDLTLFVVREKELVPVLEDFEVLGDVADWDAVCAGTWENRKATIAVSPRSGDGFADLIASEELEVSTEDVVDGECADTGGHVTRHKRTLRFRDGKYQ